MSVRPALPRRGILALAALVCLGAPARAEDDVHIAVVSILATTKNDKVDERVACVAAEMKKIDPKLTGFSLARITRKELQIGKKDCFEVVDGQDVCVTAEKRWEKDPKRVCLKIEAPTLGPITFTTCCGKFVPVVTRYKNKNGDLLIIAVGVNACKEE
jgi:hypothetical protein